MSSTEHMWPMKMGGPSRSGDSVSHAAPRSIAEPSWVLPVSDSVLCARADLVSAALILGALGVALGFAVAGLCILCNRCRSRRWRSTPWLLLGIGCLALVVALVALLPGMKLGYPRCPVQYQSPVIDADGNVYVGYDSGLLVSLTSTGSQRWVVQFGGTSPHVGQIPTPSLSGSFLYVVNGEGEALSLRLADGSERWRVRYVEGKSGMDGWSVLAYGGVVLVAGFANPAVPLGWGTGRQLVALDDIDGHVLWRFEMPASGYNLMPALSGDVVVVADRFSSLSCLDFKTGALRWQQPALPNAILTTGGAAIDPDGHFVFATGNVRGDSGVRGTISAFDLKNGTPLWRQFFDLEANAAPTVHRLAETGRSVVATGLGQNAGMPWPISWAHPVPIGGFSGQFVALDAATGETLWMFEPPRWLGRAAASSELARLCLPDAWSNAIVDSRGTLYVGWQGGILYALNISTGGVLSSHSAGAAFQAAPALGPGLLLAASCTELLAFRDGQDTASPSESRVDL